MLIIISLSSIDRGHRVIFIIMLIMILINTLVDVVVFVFVPVMPCEAIRYRAAKIMFGFQIKILEKDRLNGNDGNWPADRRL
jgi:hypothetical protein